MSIRMRNPYEAPEPSINTRGLVDLLLLSLLAHALIITAILLITVFMPVPKIIIPVPAITTLTLTPLPPPVPATPKKPLFIPTTPQPNVPHKVQPVESANDTELTSKSPTARKPDSIMPDVTGREHAPNLNETPNVQTPPKPEVSSTPPTPKQPKPEKPTPPQPPQPPAKPRPPTPPKKPQPQVDENGLPVLPPLAAPTMAQVNPALASPPPAVSMPQEATSVHGALGRRGDNSPAAMATALGKYKQKIYLAVGSRWYPDVNQHFQTLGVGVVRVQYTIHYDGSVETKVLDPGNSTMQQLLSISINSIRDSAPFDKFEDYPGLREEIIKEQGGDGSSYTDDFTFSIYGQ